MTNQELIFLRLSWGWSQTNMADHLGLPLGAYQDLENRKGDLLPVYALAIERLGLAHASAMRDPGAASGTVRREALELARLLAA